MKVLWLRWTSVNIVTRILVAIVVGAVLALLVPQASGVVFLGTLFTSALKSVAPILVFFLVISALAKHQVGVKTNIKTILGLYAVSTFAAGLVAVVASFLWPTTLLLTNPPEDITAPSGIGEVLQNLFLNIVTNPVTAIMEANYMGILAWAVLLGLAFKSAAPHVKDTLHATADAISNVVQVVIQLAPLGILGLVFEAIAINGLAALGQYGRLLIVLVGSMLFVALVINPLVIFLVARRNPYPLVWTVLRESGVTAFFTRSSAANIPVNMKLSQKLGLNPDTYAVSIPLGATINMAGAAITISVLTLATVHTLGIAVDFATALLLVLMAALGSAGTSGVAGGSVLLIPLATSLFGIPADIAAQVVGIGFIIGVVQDSSETALNSSSDVIFTAAAEYASQRSAS